MRENVKIRPPQEVEARTRGQERETGLGDRQATFPLEHQVEALAQRMQMKNVGRSISNLRIGQRFPTPIGQLLLF